MTEKYKNKFLINRLIGVHVVSVREKITIINNKGNSYDDNFFEPYESDGYFGHTIIFVIFNIHIRIAFLRFSKNMILSTQIRSFK